MIKKLICFLWGHKIVRKVYNGKTMTINGFYGKEEIPFYRYEKSNFCIRCGKKIKDI